MKTFVVRELSYSQGKHRILQDISFQVPPGSITVLLGPNGSGKSTLIKNCLHLWKPHSGEVYYGAKPIAPLTPRERSKLLAYVPQHSSLQFPVPVHEVVAQGRYSHLHSLFFTSDQEDRIVQQALERVNASSLKDRFFTQLSGGEKQRVLLARALVTEAPVLLLDEPTSSLDVRYVVEMNALFKTIAQQGKSLILALHDLNMARQIADQVLLLSAGKIFSQGTSDEVLTESHIQAVYQVQELKNTASYFSLAPMTQVVAG